MSHSITPEPYFPSDLENYAPWVAKHGLRYPYGKCQCGCDQKTRIAKTSQEKTGAWKGQPTRFIHKHSDLNRPGDDKFWDQVNKNGPVHPDLGTRCWLWTGDHNAFGYGRYSFDGTRTHVHRVSWELHFGPILYGLFVCHKCDVKNCLRPDHLFLGTHADNMADKVAKGRQQRGEEIPWSKLTESDIPDIRKLWSEGKNLSQISRLYSVAPATIRDVVYHKTWVHI